MPDFFRQRTLNGVFYFLLYLHGGRNGDQNMANCEKIQGKGENAFPGCTLFETYSEYQ